MSEDDTVKLTSGNGDDNVGDEGVTNQQQQQTSESSSSSCASTAAVVTTDDVTTDDVASSKEEVHDDVTQSADETANLLVTGSSLGKIPPLNDVSVKVMTVNLGDGELSPTVVNQQSKSYGFGSIASIASLNDHRLNSCSEASIRSDPLLREQMENPPRWGWVVVLAAWVIMIPIAGTLASFGNFVAPLQTGFNSTKLVTGWVGSLSFGFTVGMCPASTALFSVYGARKVALFGVIGTVTGAIVSSFATSIYMMFFTYSMLFGTGANFVYNTAMNLVGQYFPGKYQALATCLATAGISTGTLAINPLAEMLVATWGWRRTLQIMSGAIAVVGGICIAAFRPPPQRTTSVYRAGTKDKNVEKGDMNAAAAVDEMGQQQHYNESKLSLAAKEMKKNVFQKKAWSATNCAHPALIFWLFGTLFWSISFLFPHIFLVDYMSTIEIESSTSSLVLLAYGCAELAGRFLCAIFSGMIPTLSYVYTACSLMAGAVAIITPQFKSLNMMYIYAISAGINSGTLNALMFVTTMQLFGNEKGKYIWGYINVMLALGMVIGPIMAGGIYDATQSYEAAFYVGGGVFILCGFVMAAIKPMLNHWPMTEKKPTKEEEENKKNRIYSRRVKKMHEKNRQQRHNGGSTPSSGVRDGKWGKDVNMHLETLTAIDEEVKQQQVNDQERDL